MGVRGGGKVSDVVVGTHTHTTYLAEGAAIRLAYHKCGIGSLLGGWLFLLLVVFFLLLRGCFLLFLLPPFAGLVFFLLLELLLGFLSLLRSLIAGGMNLRVRMALRFLAGCWCGISSLVRLGVLQEIVPKGFVGLGFLLSL